MLGKLNKKYHVIKNFLTEQEQDFFKNYCIIRHINNLNNFDSTSLIGIPNTAFYGDAVMETLMLQKKKMIEDIVQIKLFPTYTFWRCYVNGSILKKHKDRPSCEISLTVNLGTDTKWPIYIDGTPIIQNEGDAVLYAGIDVEHYREEFQGDWQAQVFIHYVDQNGPHRDWKYDKRERIGEPKNSW